MQRDEGVCCHVETESRSVSLEDSGQGEGWRKKHGVVRLCKALGAMLRNLDYFMSIQVYH